MNMGEELRSNYKNGSTSRWRNTLRALNRYKYIYILLLPGITFYFIFHYVPMYGVQLAFKEFVLNKGIWGSPFVGLEKFKYVIYDAAFWHAIANTFVISLGKLIFVFPVPIFLALLINEVREGAYKRALQTIFTFPHFLSWIIVSGIILNLLNNTGAINNLLGILGFERQQFMAMPPLFRPILCISDAWKESGWESIIYLATITSINHEIYEAAIIDGANRLQKILYITWPGIVSTVLILLILRVGYTMTSGFDQIFNMYNPVVYDVADIIGTYIYRVTFQMSSTDFGFSTALGLCNSVTNFLLLLVANKIVKLFGNEGIF